MQNVLVTGVARALPARFAADLQEQDPDLTVVGTDLSRWPGTDTGAYTYEVGDIRSPSAGELIRRLRIDTLVHLGSTACGDGVFTGTRIGALGRELTVIGTMQLLAAAARYAGLERVVAGSSTVVYPGTPRSPALADERALVATAPEASRAREVFEFEGYVHQFAEKRSDVDVAVLRVSDVVGPGGGLGLGSILRRGVVPMAAGYDPRVQVLDLDDALSAVRAVLATGATGTFNVAPADVVLWSRLVRLTGRWPVPLPGRLIPDPLVSLLRYGNSVDIRAITAATGWRPTRSCAEAGPGLVAGQREGIGPAPTLTRVEEARSDGAESDARTDVVATLGRVARMLASEGERAGGDAASAAVARLSGVLERDVDEFGFDAGFTEAVVLPVLRLLADEWFSTTTHGADRLPAGAALMVGNHAGTLPLDGPMVQVAVHDHDPAHRVVRMLAADRMFATPVLGDLTRRMGATLACAEDVDRLLASQNLVLVFPEGFKGVGKPFRDRYRLQRFGRGGFVAAALRARVPIVPISIVGSEEIYPKLADLSGLAKLLSLPYFPITPTWPWLGPLGVIPLPSRWIVDIGEPIDTSGYGPDAHRDTELVLELTDRVRQAIQQRLHVLLAERGPAF